MFSRLKALLFDLRQLFCHHVITITPIIERHYISPETGHRVGVFNSVTMACSRCNKATQTVLQVILDTDTPMSVLNAITGARF